MDEQQNTPEPVKHKPPMRDLKRERKPGTSIGFVQKVLIPGLWGILGAFIIGKVMPFFAMAIADNGLKNSLSKFATKMDKEADLLLSFQFGATDLWGIILVGFVGGVFLRHAFFGDETPT